MGSISTIVLLLAYTICLGTCLDNIPNGGKKLALRSEGIFERFIRNYLDILSTTLTGKELKRYCKLMAKELDKMQFTYTERLGRHFDRLSSKSRDEVADEMARYRREFDEDFPKRNEFFTLINVPFNAQHAVKFDDYIDDLSRYGDGNLIFMSMQEPTRNLLDMIVNCIHRLGHKERKDLEKAMRLAIREYKDNHYVI